jgi:hypothetical protein
MNTQNIYENSKAQIKLSREDIEGYLDKFALRSTLEDLLVNLFKEQPDEPYAYIAERMLQRAVPVASDNPMTREQMNQLQMDQLRMDQLQMREQMDQLQMRVRTLECAEAARNQRQSLVEQDAEQEEILEVVPMVAGSIAHDSITWVDDEGGASALLDDDGHKWELAYSSPHSKRNNALRRQQRVHRDGETGRHDTEFCWVNAWALKKIEGEVCHLGYSCSGVKGKIVWRRCSLKGGRYVAGATTEEKEHVAHLSE